MSKIQLREYQGVAMKIKDPKVLIIWERGDGKSTFVAERARRAKGNVIIVCPGTAAVANILSKLGNYKVVKSSFGVNHYQVGKKVVIVATYQAYASGALRGLQKAEAILFEEPDGAGDYLTDSKLANASDYADQVYVVGSIESIGGKMSTLWANADTLGYTVHTRLQADYAPNAINV